MNTVEYIKHPYFCKYGKFSVRKLLSTLLIYAAVSIISIPILFIITNLTGIHHISQKGYSVSTILQGVFLAPIYEEIIFRLWLKPNKSIYFIVLFTSLTLLVLCHYQGKYLCFTVLFVILFLILIINIVNRIAPKHFFLSHFKYFFWFQAVSFGLLHMANFYGSSIYPIALLSPILCFPQIAMGFILGYIRMNYGFLYGVIIHMIINSVLLIYLF